MFFVRTTLLLGLGILLLPTDQESQTRVFTNAKAAVAWSVTFCDRNPATCVQGREFWDVFKQKAEFGVRMAFDLINGQNESRQAQTPPTVAPATHRAPVPQRRNAGTLQNTDFVPPWQGKVVKSGS